MAESVNYLDRVKPTYIENWPAALCRLSIAQVDIPLTREETIAVGLNMVEWYEAFQDYAPAHNPDEPGEPPPLDGLRARLCEAVSRFPYGAFVRLGSRSPKDAWSWHETGGRVTTADDPLRYVLDCSERMAEDLRLALVNDYTPHVWVRQWLKIEPWQEFRCFQRAGKLVGISQYQYRASFPEVAEFAGVIPWAVETFHAQQFRPACHLDGVVFDVVVKARRRREPSGMIGTQTEVVLLEINPFFEMTDPCLFSWNGGGDFDGGFRWVKGNEK